VVFAAEDAESRGGRRESSDTRRRPHTHIGVSRGPEPGAPPRASAPSAVGARSSPETKRGELRTRPCFQGGRFLSLSPDVSEPAGQPLAVSRDFAGLEAICQAQECQKGRRAGPARPLPARIWNLRQCQWIGRSREGFRSKLREEALVRCKATTASAEVARLFEDSHEYVRFCAKQAFAELQRVGRR